MFGREKPPLAGADQGFWLDWIEEYVNGARNAVGEKEAVQYELQGRVMGFEKAVEYALDFEKD